MDKINSRVSLPVWLVALSALILVGILGAAGIVASDAFSEEVSASPVLYDEQTVVVLFEEADPAVVVIGVTQSYTDRFSFSSPQSGQGSGFLVDTEGHILTNYHVVQNATLIQVTLADGRTLDARIVGTIPADDIALLKVAPQEVEGIVPLPLGDSSVIKPGQMAIALGSPFGLENTITVGVVSGVGRNRTGILGRLIIGMIQTDASINPGNSGGPLLNSLGEVIGINTSIETSIDGATGIGFAVPINTAKDFLSQLIENRTVKRPWLGISGVALSDLAGLSDPDVSAGVYVTTVWPDSPAQAVELQGGRIAADGSPSPGGDIITAVDGQAVQSVEELLIYFNTLQPGDEVVLTIIRAGETLQVAVVLGDWPDSSEDFSR